MKISVFGAGLMGTPIADTLQQSGYKVTAYNRTPSKLETLKDSNIQTTTDISEAIAQSQYLLLTLSDAKAIESVLFTNSPSFTNKTIIQMGTIAPNESRDIAAKIQEQGGSYLEAPVLGSIPQAKTGTLLVMAGGDQETYKNCLPLLQKLGEEPRLIGEVGTAAALKLALNQLIASLTAGFSLSLGLIQKEGVDVESFMAILRESALYAPTFDKKLQRMGDRQFTNPNFPTKHLLKDTNLFLQAAEAAALNSEGLVGVRDIIAQAITKNLADQDYSAIYNIINPE
ncbi:NAD(P)-dependent oxidoreductase [[Limnothrix rosea] IAM M-220]|uniref:NAD(P)-dependent oxidoreductase n=1 Tax=[Limnothrix rosea] IAM M-220 TaxID=454133 RepID=UPI00095E1FBF|nr:NAD(P)-dependent oxidoreductase [[Limnothrix rosea] IAM M-220]OKH13157.1 hydroxyacid dehydrogenase [[Limnothrix rosea] IAM M-220]